MTISMPNYIITISFAPAVGILFMLLFLCMNSRMEKEIKKSFFLFLAMEFVEMAAYNWELVTAQWAHPTTLRVLLSVIGYSIRPTMIYFILLLTVRVSTLTKRAAVLAIPLFVNLLIQLSAFFTGIAFSYTEDNQFVRGPLGFSSQIVVFLYFLGILGVTFYRARERARLETLIVLAAVILCSASIIIEALFDFRSLGQTSISISIIFYFMYFQSNDYERKMKETRQANHELKKVSQSDPLTGLLTKTAFLEYVDEALCDNEGKSGVLFFFDLDNFKKYNDVMGHLEGDELLKTVARKLRVLFRSSDYIGRFGGDEFYIFMKDVAQETVKGRAELLLRDMNISSANGVVVVSASIGIVYAEKPFGVTAEELVSRADHVLYEAKKQGKNRYIIDMF